MINKMKLGDFLFLCWWGVVVLNSITDLGYLYALCWLVLVIGLLFIDYKYGLILIGSTFYLPSTPSTLTSPFLLLHILTLLAVVGSGTPRSISMFATKKIVPFGLFLVFSVVYSVLFFDSALAGGVGHYMSATLFLIVCFFLFEKIQNLDQIDFILKRVLVVAASSIAVALIHNYLGAESNLYQKILSTGDSEQFQMKLHTTSDKSVSRLIWPGVDPNFFASNLFVVLALSLYYSHKNRAFLLVAALIGMSVIGSYSRSAFITMVLMSFLLFLKGDNKKLVMVLVAALSVLAGIFAVDYVERILSISDNLANSGGSGRFERIGYGVAVVADNILGVGIGNVSQALWTGVMSEGWTTHNTYLQVLVESGILLFLLFICSLYHLLSTGCVIKSEPLIAYMKVGLLATLFFYVTIPVMDWRFFIFYVFIYVYAFRLSEEQPPVMVGPTINKV
ncbi:O-antigen ligase family protein [Pseudomonas sp. gcc21]|uniref:O-antigen ligase family protein n=1 Tax=Pseudomonas sp. gcc21 TaxID=2726989 RepID=UPI0014526541|nr:O-antigen ligase family protein [Pseudomonas sp. gcc21]QJD58676.1 O-antigen ligase family protein [Pseudomonas sp. gcc21]